MHTLEKDGSFQKYRAFLAAVELGSFTKAAKRLGYTQSGVSRMVASLEAEVGVRLLERSRSSVSLTAEGGALLPLISSLVGEADRLAEHAESLKGLATGVIRIGTFTSVATHWLPRVIAGFREDYPGVEYELLLGDYTQIEQWLAQGRIDCGFLRLPTLPEFEVEELARDEFVAVVPAGHELANADRFPVARFAEEPFMELASASDSDVSFIFEENDLDIRPVFSTWDDHCIMSMVESGLGIAVLPSLVLKRNPFRIKFLPLDVPAFRTIGIATRGGSRVSLAARRFMEYLDLR